MTSIATFAGSSVGKKVFVAVTGLMLFGFVVVHLLGNLTLLIPDGGKAFNEYAHFLESLLHGWLIIAFEVCLVAMFLVHAIFAITVALVDKQKARPQKYSLVRAAGGKSHKTLASRSMILTGPVILIFVVLHVKMFKFADHPLVTYHGTEMKDLYSVVVDAFKTPWIAIAYMVVMALLGTHLWHGVWSAFQSLGWNSDRHVTFLTRLSVVAGVVLGVGFLGLPPYVYFFAATGGH
ncbi:MAG TPA: succinate dehydrogenase cytochrome b subunit [Candidatus Krumholzibacteria bacterium]|nr:succinate dehydrogenase cytochrome b subunit [Candidatus Krumholzibacteria bacterium]HPD72290.1 succinate dehydrogenase cytochrome b subunit [Candidatus Krumholzibacteria bacterium]HRY40778.1 succinate dehydrogenase cytochrome b subunit [Candidatus Krumholzibacteria bacterium]